MASTLRLDDIIKSFEESMVYRIKIEDGIEKIEKYLHNLGNPDLIKDFECVKLYYNLFRNGAITRYNVFEINDQYQIIYDRLKKITTKIFDLSKIK